MEEIGLGQPCVRAGEEANADKEAGQSNPSIGISRERNPSRDCSKLNAGQLSNRLWRLSSVVDTNPATCLDLAISTPTYNVSCSSMGMGLRVGALLRLLAIVWSPFPARSGVFLTGSVYRTACLAQGLREFAPRTLDQRCAATAGNRCEKDTKKCLSTREKEEKWDSVSVPQPTSDKKLPLQPCIRCPHTPLSLYRRLEAQSVHRVLRNPPQ
jgi:hypothetical protein